MELANSLTQTGNQVIDRFLFLLLPAAEQYSNFCEQMQVDLGHAAFLEFGLGRELALLEGLLLPNFRFTLVGRLIDKCIVLMEGALGTNISEGRVGVGGGRTRDVVGFIL